MLRAKNQGQVDNKIDSTRNKSGDAAAVERPNNDIHIYYENTRLQLASREPRLTVKI